MKVLLDYRGADIKITEVIKAAAANKRSGTCTVIEFCLGEWGSDNDCRSCKHKVREQHPI
jgi:hypothetical protein